MPAASAAVPGPQPAPTAPEGPDAPGSQVWNRLWVGENLQLMSALPEASFDVVYLDPPYGTGHEFVYDDFRAGQPAAGRHEAWTAMMRPRLEQVRRLLTARGAVFCSIDDREAARLRLLLDEVFGEPQFVAQVAVELNPKGRQLGPGFATSHEYLIVHARDAGRCALQASSTAAVDPADFPRSAEDGRRFRLLPLRNTNKRFNPRTAPTLHYPLWGDPETGRVATTPFDGAVEVLPVFGDGTPAVWRWSAPRVEERPGDLVCRRVRGTRGERVDVDQRDWLHPGRRKKLRTIWHAAEVGSTDTAVAELKSLVGPLFDSPKPTGLLRRVLETMPDDARVLDPFAGSGTTGHAVVLANLADGGSRTCLSLNRAEPVRPGSNADLAGLGHVAEVTRARLRAVAATLGGGLEEIAERSGAPGSEAGDPLEVLELGVEMGEQHL